MNLAPKPDTDQNLDSDRQSDGTPADESDRRAAPRRRVLKGAKIFISGGTSVFDCTVRDISMSGARISLGHFQALPRRFQLMINDLGTFHCEIVRALGNDYGVRFIAADDETDAVSDATDQI